MGVHRELPVDALDQGKWKVLPDGRNVWQLGIRSSQAAGLRVQFGDFSVGAGRVWLHSGNAARQVDGPYTGEGLYQSGEFWSGTLTGESVVIEYEPGAGVAPQGRPPFRIRRIAHHTETVAERFNPDGGIPRLAALPSPSPILSVGPAAPPDPAASCNLDVSCYPEWASAEKSVAQMVFEETEGPETGTFLCSGSAVATRDDSFKPYLLTAAHCIHDEAAARSLQTYWAYETNSCGAPAPATKGTLNSSNGGHLVQSGTFEQGDFSLVLLPDIPSGVVFNGWDLAEPKFGANVTGVHHPMGSYKRIAFGQTADSSDVVIGSSFLPAGLYTTVQYIRGITQPGSSGSPLFTAPGVVVGTLTYGPDLPGDVLCLGNDVAGYGKFANTYGYLSSYLEDLPSAIVKPSTNSLHFTGLNGKIAGGAQVVRLSSGTQSQVQFKARADASWIEVSASSGAVSAASPVELQVKVNPRYLTRTDTYASTVTVLSGSAPPQYIQVHLDLTIQVSDVSISANPNPVPSVAGPNGPEWTAKLKLEERNGVATTLIGLKIDAVDYSGSIDRWFGTDKIAAHGSLQAPISINGFLGSTNKYFEFFGRDVTSGKTWYRVLEVTFQQ